MKTTVKQLVLPSILAFVPITTRAADSVTAYAPSTNIECPDLSKTSLIRTFSPQNQTLHPDEVDFISNRLEAAVKSWTEWLGDGSSLGYNLTGFTGPFPKVGIAMAGGGLRAAQYGAGCLLALDARNSSSKAVGTGGLLQVASYIVGISGSSWLTGSLFFNNWPTLDDLVFGNGQDLSGWLMDLSLATPGGNDILSSKNQAFYGSILWSVIAKASQGVYTSITDPWSRMISYHFLNQTTRDNFFTNDSAHGAGQLWSDIPQVPAYQNYQAPFPIVLANSRPVGSNDTASLSIDSVVYEITPLELASYDPFLSTGMNLTYAGTHLNKGRSINGSSCVSGFDQAGFVMGTSASLFNQVLDAGRNTISEFSQSDGQGLLSLLNRQLAGVRTLADDVANWPNPFQGLNSGGFQDSDSAFLELIDGSSNHEDIGFEPMLVQARGVDVIVALDGSAGDVNNWPNGTSFIFGSLRQKTLLQTTHRSFPPIPLNVEEFISTGLNSRPTFYGCNPSDSDDFPMIIHFPNSPPINGDNPVTNTLTFQISYPLIHSHLFMNQVYLSTVSGFTPNANTPDPNFGLCLQCAAFDRARSKSSPPIPRSSFCSQCFQKYCFDPQNLPSKSELPNRKLVLVDPSPQGLLSFLGENKLKLVGGFLALVAFVGMLSFAIIYYKKKKRAKYQRLRHSDLILESFSYDGRQTLVEDNELSPMTTTTTISKNTTTTTTTKT